MQQHAQDLCVAGQSHTIHHVRARPQFHYGKFVRVRTSRSITITKTGPPEIPCFSLFSITVNGYGKRLVRISDRVGS